MTDRLRIVRADPIPINILETLRSEGQEGWGVKAYPDRLKRMFGQSGIAKGLFAVAEIVEPVDRSIGIDPTKPVAKVFRAGGLVGLRVLAACVDDIEKATAGIALMPSPSEVDSVDDLATRQAFADAIVDIGNQAYAKVDETFDPLFDEWEHQLVPGTYHPRVFRGGFGLPMSYLFTRYSLNEEAAHAADLEAMAAQAAAIGEDTNWEALLA